MTAFQVEPSADRRLDEIYDYTADTWGEAQADAYIADLFTEFARIAGRKVIWRVVPASFGIAGYYRRWRGHVIYWKMGDDATIRIVSILHERMNQIDRLHDDVV